jgi:hypothetical protein
MATRADDLQRLGRTLVLDELFDLSLYQACTAPRAAISGGYSAS